METISIWEAKHSDYDALIRETQKKIIKIYRDYAKYCKKVADDYESQSDYEHASWYRREQLDYLRLVDELEASL